MHNWIKSRWAAIGLAWLVIGAIAIAGWPLVSPRLMNVPKEAVLVLDAGHGGYDPGAIGPGGRQEKEIALALTLKTGGYIEKNYPQIQVVYTRQGDDVAWPANVDEDLQQRLVIASRYSPDLLVSIHLNWSEDPAARGYYGFYGSGDEYSRSVLDAITREFTALGYSQSREHETTAQNPLYLVDYSTCPAILLETGFISNASEASWLSKNASQNRLAAALGRALAESLLG